MSTTTRLLSDTRGIALMTPKDADILLYHGIRTTDKILRYFSKIKDRAAWSSKMGIDSSILLMYANAADFLRIKGLGTRYIELLFVAQVRTTLELSYRSHTRLHQELHSLNHFKKIVEKMPAPGLVQSWIDQAKHLERIIHHR